MSLSFLDDRLARGSETALENIASIERAIGHQLKH
jgi:hypothetical protein